MPDDSALEGIPPATPVSLLQEIEGRWKLMPVFYLWMHLWWILLMLKMLPLMISVLMLRWFLQAPECALCFWFLCSGKLQCNNVGLDLSLHFGQMALCVIWFVDLLKIFIYEYFM